MTYAREPLHLSGILRIPRWCCWVFLFLENTLLRSMFNVKLFFSFAEGTMETDPGTELPGMPACLHHRWGALSRGKACTCKRVWKSWRQQLQYSSLVFSDGFLFLHMAAVVLVCNFCDPWDDMLVWSAHPVTFEGQCMVLVLLTCRLGLRCEGRIGGENNLIRDSQHDVLVWDEKAIVGGKGFA